MSETTKTTPRLKTRYQDEIKGQLQGEFNFANAMQVPGVVKVVVNMGVGDAAKDSKLIEGAIRDLATITGQKPSVTKARKSIAQFKLREGQPIGAHVTLRGNRAWEFLDRLVTLALPRIRDFRGLSDRQFDGHGNYTFGLAEQSVFHEIDQDRIDRVRGFDITVVTTATTASAMSTAAGPGTSASAMTPALPSSRTPATRVRGVERRTSGTNISRPATCPAPVSPSPSAARPRSSPPPIT